MTPNELMSLPHRVIDVGELWPWGLSGRHDAFGIPEWAIPKVGVEVPGVELREYGYFYTDTRRFWRLSALWAQTSPLFDFQMAAIIQQAGREGDDHFRIYIIDDSLVKVAVRHIFAAAPCPPINVPDYPRLKPTQDAPIDSFYGDRLTPKAP